MKEVFLKRKERDLLYRKFHSTVSTHNHVTDIFRKYGKDTIIEFNFTDYFKFDYENDQLIKIDRPDWIEPKEKALKVLPAEGTSIELDWSREYNGNRQKPGWNPLEIGTIEKYELEYKEATREGRNENG